MKQWLRTVLHPPREVITPGARWSVIVVLLIAVGVNALSFTFAARAISGERQAIDSTRKNAATITQLCETGNQFGRENRNLWDFVISISKPPPHESTAKKTAQAKRISEFRAYMNRVFAPRNCRAVTGR